MSPEKRSFRSCMRLSAAVQEALQKGTAVVALESSIVAQGLPWPENLRAAIACEEAIVGEGATPATCAILHGVPVVGCSRDELQILAGMARDAAANLRKVAKRDIGKCIADGACGGTTVSATLTLAAAAGIEVFATGGIGGVHRGVAESFDISADVTALAQTPVLVVCAGAKTVLDIPKTLEAFETASVPVLALNPDELNFPGFYVRKSGSKVPRTDVVRSELEAANVVSEQLRLNSAGTLLAVPVPRKHEADSSMISDAVQTALSEAKANGVSGRNMTPFLLGRVAELSRGHSVEANIQLVMNNAATAARIACHMCARRNCQSRPVLPPNESFDVIVAGSCAIDIISLSGNSLRMRTSNPGFVNQSIGGVGRNIAEVCASCGTSVFLLSAVGNDALGAVVLSNIQEMGLSIRGVEVVQGGTTATYVAMSSSGDLVAAISDMSLFDKGLSFINNRPLTSLAGDISRCKLVVIDGNLSVQNISKLVEAASRCGVDVWYEPVSVAKSTKIVTSQRTFSEVSYMSPNVDELRAVWASISAPSSSQTAGRGQSDIDLMARDILRFHQGSFLCVVCTQGAGGVTAFSKSTSTLFQRVHVPAVKVPDGELVSTSGAGDALAGAVVSVLAKYGRDGLVDALEHGVRKAAECCAAEGSKLRRPRM